MSSQRLAQAAAALSTHQTNRTAVLATYRHLLRAIRYAFIGPRTLSPDGSPAPGDWPMWERGRKFARQEFDRAVRFAPGSTEAAQGVEHAQGVAQILREHVVQGRNVGGDRYKLRFTEHTQRLDNETAGKLKGTTKSFGEIRRDMP